MSVLDINHKITVYAFVGPSGTGKSYRAGLVASEHGISYIIDDGLFIKENEMMFDMKYETVQVFLKAGYDIREE